MIMADILFWTLIVLGIYSVLIAYWIGAFALWPALVERCRATYGVRPVASTLLGLVTLPPALVLGIFVAKTLPHPLVQVPITGALLLLGLLSLIGSAGLALRVGTGMSSPLDARQPWRRLLRGGMVLGLVFAMPFLGWFVLLPWGLLSGFGALLLSRRARVPAVQHAPVLAVPVES